MSMLPRKNSLSTSLEGLRVFEGPRARKGSGLAPFAGSLLREPFSGGETRRPSLPPMQPGRVDFEALYAWGGIVIDAVPQADWDRYRYWRGADLGKIAMNFARGTESLNAGQRLATHFTDKRWYAARYASGDGAVSLQMTATDRAELAAFTGRSQSEPLPGILLALDERFNDIDLPLTTLAMGDGGGRDGGVVYDGVLTTSMIDPFSRAVIENLRIKWSGCNEGDMS